MKRPLALIAATLASTAALAACGSSTAGLIPPTNAQAIGNAITALTTALQNHDCAKTRSALQNVSSNINALPASLDRRLYDNLQQGYTELVLEAPSQCKRPAARNTGTTGTHHHKKASTGLTGTSNSTGTTQGGTPAPTGPTGATTTTSPTGPTTSTGPTSTTSAGGGIGPGDGSSGSSGDTSNGGATSG